MKWFDRQIDNFIKRIRDDPERQKTKIFVGNEGDPTYWRWFVLPRNPVLNIYLHNFLKDDDHDLHDHRAVNISIILQGWYFEERFMWRPVEYVPLPFTHLIKIKRLRPLFRLPSTPHRVVLPRDRELRPIPCWSLFIKFPDVRDWGFWCPGRKGVRAFWRSHKEYAKGTDPTSPDYGIRGRGCDE